MNTNLNISKIELEAWATPKIKWFNRLPKWLNFNLVTNLKEKQLLNLKKEIEEAGNKILEINRNVNPYSIKILFFSQKIDN